RCCTGSPTSPPPRSPSRARTTSATTATSAGCRWTRSTGRSARRAASWRSAPRASRPTRCRTRRSWRRRGGPGCADRRRRPPRTGAWGRRPPAESSGRRCGSSPTRASSCRSARRAASTAPPPATRCRCVSSPRSGRSTSCCRSACSPRRPRAARCAPRPASRRPMYELSRVRLFSVGPPGARYQDVTLDLRGVGPAVQAAQQVDLFAPDDLERVPRRPSPASVLFLENGGGKAVLLKLIFSVLLPGRRQVVGTTSTTVLVKFVLGEDVAHVVLEWMHTATGRLLVTGKVSEWRGHVTSLDPEKLGNAWYSFRPVPDFGLDVLPLNVDGRRVTTTGFKDRRVGRHRELPALELVWETGPRDWTRHLSGIGLDPELFRYQRAMNAGEGEAAEAFAFPTDEAFVDFLLRAVLDPEEPQNLADLVAGYATRLAQRADLELEREFVDGTLARLGPLTEAERAAAAARDAEAAAHGAARALAAAIVARRRAEDER